MPSNEIYDKSCQRGYHSQPRENKVIRPKSCASALSVKSGRKTNEQTKTFKKTFELAKTSFKNNFVTY